MLSLPEAARSVVNRTSHMLGLKISRSTPNQIRGQEPLADLQFLLGRESALTVFDIGANDGETSQALLETFPAAKVVAIEPAPEVCAQIRQRNTSPRLTVEQLAMGAEPGELELNNYDGNRMNSFLELNTGPKDIMNRFKKTGKTKVRVETVDRYCAEKRIGQIHLLKVDTQGFDLNVLRGAAGLLEAGKIGAVMLEVNFVEMYRGQASFGDLHGFLASHGFKPVDFYNHVRKNGHTAWCDSVYVGPGVIAAHTR